MSHSNGRAPYWLNGGWTVHELGVVSEEAVRFLADVDFGFRADAACLLYQPQVTVDTPVLVHMGFVMEELDEKRADEALTLRKEIAGE
jgi:hydrogenase maturation factor